ncbi:MAG TPA: LysR substrate-binding domain-containing protein [Bordetella sp.]|nr:LysR substrate-binding domain-containing protein [Bordetella sp.]
MSAPTDPADALYNRLLGRVRMRHLQLLVAISEHGSIQAAADSVGLTQPAATHAIREIEGLLDVELFERHSRGVRPNEYGLLVIGFARSSLMGLRRSTETVVALRENGAAVVRIGAIEAAARFLCSILPAFSRRHPGVQLLVTEDYGHNLLPQLVSGQLDLVLSRYADDCPGSVQCTALLDDKAVVVANPFHVLTRQPAVGLADLSEYAWIVAPAGTQTRSLFTLLCEQPCAPRAAPVCTTSMPLVAELLKDHRHVALLPQSLADKLIEWNLVQVLNIDLGPLLSSKMAGIAVFRNPTMQSGAINNLYTALLDGVRDYPARIVGAGGPAGGLSW